MSDDCVEFLQQKLALALVNTPKDCIYFNKASLILLNLNVIFAPAKIQLVERVRRSKWLYTQCSLVHFMHL